jgi:uncharacterized membrane protein YjjP (DUF1212 family)
MTSEDRINNIVDFICRNGQNYKFVDTFILDDVIVSRFNVGKTMSSKTIQYKSDRIVLDQINGINKIMWLISDESLLDTVENILNDKTRTK